MSEVTTKITDAEEQFLDGVSNVQDRVLEVAKKVVENVESLVPELKLDVPESVPSAEELVDTQFAFANKFMKNQQKFASALIDVAKPVSDKVVSNGAAPAPKSRPKAAPKSAAKAA